MKKKTPIFVLLFIALAGCQNTLYEGKETPSMTDLPRFSIEEVEKIARIKIPASASEIQVYAETGWMDNAALIKFTLLSDELDSFLEIHGFYNLKEGYWSIQNAPPSVDWWPRVELNSKPPIAVYLGERLHFPGFSQSILIDVTNEDFYVIYLQCFEI